MDAKTHWNNIYDTKTPDAVSWYRAHLETSLALIERAAANRSASIIDVGGGESTLVDDLLARGYENITVLDISQTAIDVTRKRLNEVADRVHWIAGDVTQVELAVGAYDVRQVARAVRSGGHVIVWHDRTVFHFLTRPEERLAYVSTSGPEGPTKCSGLDVVRYDADSLHEQFGARFRLVDSTKELHQTPFGTTQQFLYCYCRMVEE